jgi:hypothetical protein
MTRRLIIILSLIGLLFYAFLYYILFAVDVPANHTEKMQSMYGAHLLTIGWRGEMAAYKWNGHKYEIIWTRKGRA